MAAAAVRLREWAEALGVEAQAQRREAPRQKGLPLADGRQIAVTSAGAVYRFEMLTESHIPEGSEAILKVHGDDFRAEVLHRGEEDLTVFIDAIEGELPPAAVPSASLVSDPSFLTAELAQRMRELVTGEISHALELLIDRCAGGLAPAGRAYAVPDGVDLNAEQEQAVGAALVEPLWFCWGPPGTGKTRTVGAYVAECASRGQSVLVSAHSNVAVDAALESTASELEARGLDKLLDAGLVLRAGPSVLTAVRERRLSSRDTVLAQNPQLDKDRRSLEAQLRRGRFSEAEVAELRDRLAGLRAQIRGLEGSLIAAAKVLFCTLPKAALDPRIHGRPSFDVGVVDEASMAQPPQVALAASMTAGRLGIFGDFRQLAPIVTSQEDQVRRLLGRDIFALAGVSTVVDRGQVPAGVTMLEAQHRMHPDIRRVVSDLSYLGRLRDGPGTQRRVEPLLAAEPNPGTALVAVNTRLEGSRGWYAARHASRLSPISALWTVSLAAEALMKCQTVALLTPYRAQAHVLIALVRDLAMKDRFTVGTVHRMQGAEADAVFVDLVDGPPLTVPGQLFREPGGRRLVNVALSRAKGKLVILGDPNLMRPSDSFKATGAALESIRTDNGWTPGVRQPLRAGQIRLEHIPSLDAAIAAVQADTAGTPCVAWIGTRAPEAIRPAVALSPPVDPAQPDQAVISARDVTWVLGERPHGGWTGWRVVSTKFADALYDQLAGGPRPLPACPTHHEATVIESAYGGHTVSCPHPSCSFRRRATQADFDLWALYTDNRCPRHNHVLTGRLGGNGWFYSCPTCKHTAPI